MFTSARKHYFTTTLRILVHNLQIELKEEFITRIRYKRSCPAN